MPRPFPKPQDRNRDGQSQSMRAPRALDPGYVRVDERSPQDLLRFVAKLCRELRFVDPEQPLRELDWSGLLGDGAGGEVDLGRVVAFMEDPAAATEAERERFSRPHFALLLAFIRLFGIAQEHLNELTRRHLDFFYADILRMERRPPKPDTVNLVLKPARGVDAVLIAAGTEFSAGKDSDGVDRIYTSDRDLVVNQAEVDTLSALFVDQRVTGIREANERRDPGTNVNDRFVRMFAYTLGEPMVGDPIPAYEDQEVDLGHLLKLRDRVAFAAAELYLELHEVRALAQLKRRRDLADDEWATINAHLEIAGRKRLDDPEWKLSPTDPRDFQANLDKTIGEPVNADFFAGLPEVRSIDDLYAQHQLESAAWQGTEHDSDVCVFIRDRLFFSELGDFDRMMALKTRIDAEWAEINLILERAGQRKRGDRSYRLGDGDPTAFDAHFDGAIGGPGFSWPAGVSSIDSYDAALSSLEAHFYMSAETFAYVMAAAPGADPAPTTKQWERIYEMLAKAHRAKVYAGRRARLAELREAEGWHRTLYYALGSEPSSSDESPLPQLKSYVRRAADYAYLEAIDRTLADNQGDESSVDAGRWERAIQLVELAQRIREQLPEPVARRIEWRNLYAAADATKLQVRVGLDSDTQAPRWHTFGAKPAISDEAAPPEASFGWAIASPMLSLSEGQRTIVLTLGFASDAFSEAKILAALEQDAFIVEVTGEDAWLAPSSLDYATGDYATLSGTTRELTTPLSAIRLRLTFAIEADPLTALPYADSGVDSEEPALRLRMRQIWDPEEEEFITLYEPFAELELVAAHLKTEAKGLTAIELSNDRGPLDPKRPFEPFGLSPAAGSRLFIGHPELARNTLDSVSLNLQWMGAPTDLGAHYSGYGLGSPTNASFKAAITAIDHRRRFALQDSAPLFATGDAGEAHTITFAGDPEGLGRLSDFKAARELLDWDRYLELELTPLDFQHSRYGAVANQRSVEFSAAIAGGGSVDAADFTVNPPYTPKAKSLTVDYTSSVEVLLDEPELVGDEAFFHVRAFGAHPIQREEGALRYRLLPAHESGGELYIGLRGAQAPQIVTLLLQLAEGSADPDLEPVAVTWSYLSGDRWLSLHNGDLLRDTTRGLINTGIVELSLPAAAPSTQLDPALYWLRVSIPRSTESVCDVVEIRAQALSATFSDRGNASEHYQQPLPAGSITAPLVRNAKLKTALQLYTSYGGAARERDEVFHVRVSERLRHKQRALTTWDYERLILEHFPELYKVKCIPASPSENTAKLGLVDIVVIPDIREQLPFDPFEPKVPADRIADITGFITPLAPPFARLQVRNARYIEVKVRFGVHFREGVDVGFYRKQLSEDLSRFLSPWAYAEGADIVIGGRIYANSIIDFVDRRDYVDHLATIKLFRSRDGEDFELVTPSGDGGYYVSADRPDEILVAAREHEIDVITDVEYDTELFSGINNMKVELDFVVG